MLNLIPNNLVGDLAGGASSHMLVLVISLQWRSIVMTDIVSEKLPRSCKMTASHIMPSVCSSEKLSQHIAGFQCNFKGLPCKNHTLCKKLTELVL